MLWTPKTTRLPVSHECGRSEATVIEFADAGPGGTVARADWTRTSLMSKQLIRKLPSIMNEIRLRSKSSHFCWDNVMWKWRKA